MQQARRRKLFGEALDNVEIAPTAAGATIHARGQTRVIRQLRSDHGTPIGGGCVIEHGNSPYRLAVLTLFWA